MTVSSLTLLTQSVGWLGGARYLQQLSEVVTDLPGGQVKAVGSMREPGVDRRLPMGLIHRLPARTQRQLGRALWSGLGPVHRTTLDIPPAPNELMTLLDLTPLHFPDEGALPESLADQVRRARGVITLSQTIADEIEALFPETRTFIVPPCLDDTFFAETAPAESDGDFVLHVGGATQRKGLQHLADCWARLKAERPALTMRMIGPESSGRRCLTDQPGVEYLGLVDRQAHFTLMATAASLIVPSRYEGFGIPVAEALALGTPVVVLANTACAEVGAEFAFKSTRDEGAAGLTAAILSALSARTVQPRRLAHGRKHAHQWRADQVRRRQLAAYTEAFHT